MGIAGYLHLIYGRNMNILLILLSGVLFGVSFPARFGSFVVPNLGFLAWFALVPLLFAIRHASWRRAFVMTFFAALVWFGISFCWIYPALNVYGGLPSYVSVGVLLLLLVMQAAFIALAPLFSALVESSLGIKRCWTLPLFWVAIDFLRHYFPANGFPWGNITNTQYDYLPIIQSVDVLGIWGLTFLMVLFNVWISEALASVNRINGGEKLSRYLSAATIALFILNAGYGYFRITQIGLRQNSEASIRIASVQGNVPQEMKWREGLEESQLAPLVRLTKMLSGSGVDLIIWPEASYPFIISENAASVSAENLGLNGFKSSKDVYLLFGGLTGRPSRAGNPPFFFNSMYLADKNGALLGKYSKTHLVPFGEYVPYKKFLFFAKKLVAPVGNFEAGTSLEPLFTDQFQIGSLVCYEDLFPQIARKQTRLGANILAVITNDAWYGNTGAAYQHLAFSVFRAVENRRWLVRSANTGVSAVIDATGKVISSTGLFEDGLIVANAGLRNDRTIYSIISDSFAWAALAVSAILVFIAVIRKKGLCRCKS